MYYRVQNYYTPITNVIYRVQNYGTSITNEIYHRMKKLPPLLM